MKKLSLRMRLTLMTTLILTAICVILTLLSMRNADIYLVAPIISAIAPGEMAGIGEADLTQASYAVEPVPAMERDFNISPGERGGVAEFTVTAKQTFDLSSILYMLAIIVGGGVVTYLALGRALRPVRRLTEEIDGITVNELSQRIEGFDAHDEISRLADSFNVMLSRLDKAFAEQKRFASDAAHELKTPLAAIRTNIDVLQMDDAPAPEEYKETVEVVKKQAARMSRLVDDLFAMSGGQEYDFNDTVCFDKMFAKIAADLKPEIDKKHIQLSIGPCGYCTKGNDVMLQRAFSNLVENAVKYNKERGAVDISMTADKKYFTITVQDTGAGIPKEKLPYIFEPFYRADASRSRKAGGAGLGLAIARDIFERHGGSVSAVCTEEGTAFTVILPAVR